MNVGTRRRRRIPRGHALLGRRACSRFALVALRDPTRTYQPPSVDPTQVGGPGLVQRQLETTGGGPVPSSASASTTSTPDVAALRAEGVKFVLDAPASYAVRTASNVVDPQTTFGVTVALAQHDQDAYAQWRKPSRNSGLEISARGVDPELRAGPPLQGSDEAGPRWRQ